MRRFMVFGQTILGVDNGQTINYLKVSPDVETPGLRLRL